MISLGTGLWRGQGAGFNPLSLSPALWLDASDSSTLFQSNGGAAAAADGDPVGYWMDKSGNGRHLTQTSGVNKPLLKLAVKNGKNGVLFNSTSAYFNLSSYTHPSSVTVFRVFQRSATAKEYFTFTDSSGSDYPFWIQGSNKLYVANSSKTFTSTSTNTSTGFFLIQASYTSTSDMACWLNGASVPGSIAGTASGALAWTLFGKFSTFYANGNVCEDIVFPSALSAGDITNMNTYLNSKWAIY